MSGKVFGKYLVYICLAALPIQILVFSLVLGGGDPSVRQATFFLLIFGIAIGFSLQRVGPASSTSSHGSTSIRMPFRYLAGLISVLGFIGVAGATWSFVGTPDTNLVFPALLIIPTAIATGFIALKGRVPFTKK